MKIFAYGAGVIIIGLIIYSVIGDADKRYLKRQIRDIEASQAESQRKIDRMEVDFAKTRDSLDMAFQTIRVISDEREIAKQDRINLEKKYEAIIYTRFDSDSVRDIEIAKLYPSFRPR